jgi:hypothetical protein
MIPAPGTIAYRDVPFHVLHDAEIFPDDGRPARLFVNPRAFADGSPKQWPDECNLSGPGMSVPAGSLKKIARVVVHVQKWDGERVVQATKDDLFPAFDEDVGHGFAAGKDVDFYQVPDESKGGGEYRLVKGHPEGGSLLLVGQEMFEVEVTPPEAFRGGYCRVSLLGMASFAV